MKTEEFKALTTSIKEMSKDHIDMAILSEQLQAV